MACYHLVDGAFFQQQWENLFTHRLGENQFGEAPPGLLPLRGAKNDERTTIFQPRVKYLLPFSARRDTRLGIAIQEELRCVIPIP
jgi:hypothetical protein